MVTLKLNAAIPDFLTLLDKFDGVFMLEDHAAQEAQWGDGNGLNGMIFAGTQFAYNNDFTFMTGGNLESITFREDSTETTLAKMTDVTFDLADLVEGPPLDGEGFFLLLMAGKDKITGSIETDILHGYGGNDLLNGGAGADELHGDQGKDTYIGGKGRDAFYIGEELGNDVIRDFDATGGGDKQDYLAPFGEFDIVKSGKNVLIKFDGATVTLLDVKFNQVTESGDFMM